MKRLFPFLVLLISNCLSAQIAPEFYLISFTDKTNSPFSVSQPQAYLSETSIARREKLNISITAEDLPVNAEYVSQVLSIGGCKEHHRLKWLNALTIQITDTIRRQEILDHCLNLPFVAGVRHASNSPSHSGNDHIVKESIRVDEKRITKSNLQQQYEAFYGPSYRQVSMINAHILHEMGFTGEGVVIALFDSGWDRTDQLPIFDRLRERNAILGTKDFAFPESNNVYNISNHGTFVLSTIAGYMPDSLIGTAPDASYYLFRTENVLYEYLIEEYNWAAAAEYADSIGVDIINSSLGYSRFDDPAMNHTYADMNGDTTPSAVAADRAAARGILVVNSAGNSGHQPWFYITSPSDGDSVLCVGAVDARGYRAFFSGFGPSADGDVKPDVVAMGQATVFADLDGSIRTGNGTSFSSPIMAGGAALLMQACKKEKSNMQIIDAIRQSAHRYNAPSDSIGYGIPDLYKALGLVNTLWKEQLEAQLITVFPNPAEQQITVTTEWIVGLEKVVFEIFDESGRIVLKDECVLNANGMDTVRTIQWPPGFLPRGLYTVRASTEQERRYGRFIVR